MNLTGLTLSRDFPAFFRFREVAGKIVITNQEGSFLILSKDDFGRFAEGKVEPDSELYRTLAQGNFVRAEYDQSRAADMLGRRKRFLHSGPNLHMIVVTLRCNETCLYCHASRANMDAVQTDMTAEIGEKTVDLILETTNPFVTIEFQGGEPLVNWDVMKHIIEYALERNKTVGKQLEFTMVSNMALLDDEKLDYLIDKRVQICTSIDGPKVLHDKQRKLPMASAYDHATAGIRRVNAKYRELGLEETLYHVEALVTTTRETLPLWKELVDTYVDLGCRALFLRPVDPFGFAQKTKHKVEYPRAAYMEFYRNALDYIIELNKQGVEILERYAGIFLTKILGGEDPNFLDIRSPSGAGIGGLAYNYDGKVFISDEGRMLHEMGDDAFLLGDVRSSTYREIVGHDSVRAVVIAGNRDGQPDCVGCTYNPYCGTDPIHHYKAQGTIFGRIRESTLCQVHKGIQDYLFEKLAEADPEVLNIFEKWTTIRPRDHFVHK